MSLKDLVTSQPVEEVSTTSTTENVTVENDNEDGASTTSVNVDGEQVSENNEHPRFQKRINELSGRNKELQEELIAAKAAKETLENNMEHFSSNQDSEKRLSDLGIDQLKDFITKARDNEELEIHIPEAQEYLTEKMVDEKLSRFEQDKSAKDLKLEGQNLTNVMLNNLAGDRLKDTEGEYFQKVLGEINSLEQDEFKHVNKDQLIAVLLTEVDHLKSQTNELTLSEKIVENRNTNNTIMTNSRSANMGGSNLNNVLKDNPRLTKSSQGKGGSLRSAIMQLDAVKSFKGG